MAYLEYKPNSPLYHYCSAAGFDGVTSNGSVWLSDLQHANDPKELHLVEVLDRVLLDMFKNESSAPLRVAYRKARYQLQNMRPRFGFYSFSLSLKADQLPMWQEYTDRGRGYCIAFRATAFNDMSLRVQRVRYAEPPDYGALHPIIASILAPLADPSTGLEGEIGPITELLSLIIGTKDVTWQHEDEVRLVFSSMSRPQIDGRPLPVGIAKDGTQLKAKDPLTRHRDGIDVPYFDMKFGRDRSGRWEHGGAISEVIIGPNNSREIKDVKAELESKGYRDAKVTKSKCVFRP